MHLSYCIYCHYLIPYAAITANDMALNLTSVRVIHAGLPRRSNTMSIMFVPYSSSLVAGVGEHESANHALSLCESEPGSIAAVPANL